MVSKDSKPKRRYARFLLTVYVAALTFVPMDIGTSLLWVGGFAAALWSVIQLIGSGIRLLARNAIHWPTAVAAPILTICCFMLSGLAARFSFGVAEKFSSKAAQEIQQECQSVACPTALKGWEQGAYNCASRTREGYFTHYYICYSRFEDGQSFRLRLRRDIDTDIIWTGGRHADLQRQGIDDW